mmetsp:Transcript_43023/g.109357  ORF Transcript_43023/g.109357 Transcript_43023/m.109357 type:complete len:238 (-) Transcript_43023:4-717(-)
MGEQGLPVATPLREPEVAGTESVPHRREVVELATKAPVSDSRIERSPCQTARSEQPSKLWSAAWREALRPRHSRATLRFHAPLQGVGRLLPRLEVRQRVADQEDQGDAVLLGELHLCRREAVAGSTQGGIQETNRVRVLEAVADPQTPLVPGNLDVCQIRTIHRPAADREVQKQQALEQVRAAVEGTQKLQTDLVGSSRHDPFVDVGFVGRSPLHTDIARLGRLAPTIVRVAPEIAW